MMHYRRRPLLLILLIACTLYIGFKVQRKTPFPYLNIKREMHISKTGSTTETYPDPIPGVPYQYPDEVDLRFIVMVYNRPKSLNQSLNHLDEIILDKSVKARIEIWIDRSKKGDVDNMTLKVAQEFVWEHGAVGIHVWPCHVGIYGQWIDTWRPQIGSKEIVVLLEDDIDVSPYVYRWLHAARDAYVNRHDIGSIAVNDEDICVATGKNIRHALQRPKNETTFLFPILTTWGLSPIGASWRVFQDWYHNVTGNTTETYHPYTPGATLQTQWYKSFEKRKFQDSMWSLWYINFCYLHKVNTLFPNIGFLTGKSLTRHRRSKGLHYKSAKEVATDKYLMKEWKESYVQFPLNPVKYNYNGTVSK